MSQILIPGIFLIVCVFLTANAQEFKPRITHVSNHVTEQGAASFVVHWEPPRHVRGELTGYQITVLWPQQPESDLLYRNQYRSDDVDKLSFPISGLKPYSEYNIQVVALGTLGTSPPSDKFSALTDTAAPSPPQNPTLVALGTRAAKVDWEAPAIVYKSVDSYAIEVTTVGGRPVLNTTTTATTINLTGLVPGDQYVLRLAALSQSLYSSKLYRGLPIQLEFSLHTEMAPVGSEPNPNKHSSTGTGSMKTTARPTARPKGPLASSKDKKRRGKNSDAMAARTALANLNWLRSGIKNNQAQMKLAKVQTEVAELTKAKLELEVARMREDL